MKRLILTLLTSLSLSILSVQADKPKWAGEGGKPSDSEKEQHVEEMRDKQGDKKNKNKNKDKKNKNKDSDDSDWEKARKDLEDNVRANNRGMISSQPLN